MVMGEEIRAVPSLIRFVFRSIISVSVSLSIVLADPESDFEIESSQKLHQVSEGEE